MTGDALQQAFLIILYLVLIILVIVSIILVIKMIKTMTKIDNVVDDINIKVSKLNGLFHMIDTTTDAISMFSDRMIGFLSESLSRIFDRKKKGEENE